MKTILTITLLYLLSASTAWSDSYKFSFRKDIILEDKIELILANFNGSIEIRGNASNELIIDAEKRVDALTREEAEELAEFIEIDVTQKLDQINIQVENKKKKTLSFWQKLWGSSDDDKRGEVNFSIQVPQETYLEIHNKSGSIAVSNITESVKLISGKGDIAVKDLNGNLNLDIVSGLITLERINGSIVANIGSSPIDLLDITGKISINSVMGNKNGRNIEGQIEIDQTSGHVELTELSGYAYIKTVSGDIEIDQSSGNFNIQTASGNVNIRTELSSKDKYFATTSTGDISVVIPLNGAARIKTESAKGNISVDLPLITDKVSSHKITGTLGENGPDIILFSESGDIRLGGF